MITIPAVCLDALGDLIKTDAPVVYTRHETEAWHPLDEHARPYNAARLALPQSEAALKQVLARHLQLELEKGEELTFVVHYNLPPTYVLTAVGPSLQKRALCSFAPYPETKGIPHVRVPTLDPDMSRERIFAEVIVWIARVERVKRLGHDPDGVTIPQHGIVGPKSIPAGPILSLVVSEQSLRVPKWEVLVAT